MGLAPAQALHGRLTWNSYHAPTVTFVRCTPIAARASLMGCLFASTTPADIPVINVPSALWCLCTPKQVHYWVIQLNVLLQEVSH